jgi:hypothetical protein
MMKSYKLKKTKDILAFQLTEEMAKDYFFNKTPLPKFIDFCDMTVIKNNVIEKFRCRDISENREVFLYEWVVITSPDLEAYTVEIMNDIDFKNKYEELKLMNNLER